MSNIDEIAAKLGELGATGVISAKDAVTGFTRTPDTWDRGGVVLVYGLPNGQSAEVIIAPGGQDASIGVKTRAEPSQQLTWVQNADGTKTGYNRDPRTGNLVAATDPEGNPLTQAHGVSSQQLKWLKQADGSMAGYNYDPKTGDLAPALDSEGNHITQGKSGSRGSAGNASTTIVMPGSLNEARVGQLESTAALNAQKMADIEAGGTPFQQRVQTYKEGQDQQTRDDLHAKIYADAMQNFQNKLLGSAGNFAGGAGGGVPSPELLQAAFGNNFLPAGPPNPILTLLQGQGG